MGASFRQIARIGRLHNLRAVAAHDLKAVHYLLLHVAHEFFVTCGLANALVK